ncbi:MAG: RecQ family ATP-dependent DNA helicase [Bacteroidetes bacterium]|nr:RecQ family ATP-dependent DNA helicase [Bacteroidota bacterium]
MNELHEILQKYWKHSQFRPLQKEIIESVLAGKDTLALLPTGGGKSICFQIPAMAKEGICIVVSPLVALMKDQVYQLVQKGIPATAIFSGMHKREIEFQLNKCIYGEVKFLYVSPERLKTPIFIERFKSMKVNLIAVDEAHCISQWGYDFRPSYLDIAEIRTYHPVPVIALTATATTEVAADIQEKLLFKKNNLFQVTYERENLTYHFAHEENKMQKTIELLNHIKGSGLIYLRNRAKTKKWRSI